VIPFQFPNGSARVEPVFEYPFVSHGLKNAKGRYEREKSNEHHAAFPRKGDSMTQAQPGDTVQVHYTGRRQDGRIFASTKGGEPVEVKIGEGKLMPGFEEGVIGMKVGERKSIKVPPEQAHGPWVPELLFDIDKKDFPGHIAPDVGKRLHVRHEDGSVLEVVITAVDEKSVSLDANHPLAGETLDFDIQLLGVAQGLAIAGCKTC
jgi:FKBP-type peptidyl-prolyl cis-trans isomerase 2